MRKVAIPFILFLVLVVVSSCNKRAQLLYVNGIGNEKLNTQNPSPYTLKSGDVLYVQILTQDPNVSNLFNNRGFSGASATNLFSSDASFYLYGYSVNDSGAIRLPVFGKIPVGGLTIQQAQDLIQTETDKQLNDGLAVVKLLNYKITVLGEVNRPGVYTNFKDNISIFEGLAMAGDLTVYAERNKIILVRQTNDGVKTIRVNLQDKNIINSEAFYLVPNDMIIAEPRKGKIFSMNSPNISIYLSIISTTLLLLNVFK